MKKIIEPCGLHCIKMNHLGVTIGNQTILEDVNMHIHCGTLNAVIGRNGAGKTKNKRGLSKRVIFGIVLLCHLVLKAVHTLQ